MAGYHLSGSISLVVVLALDPPRPASAICSTTHSASLPTPPSSAEVSAY